MAKVSDTAFLYATLSVQYAPTLTKAATAVARGAHGAVVVRRAVRAVPWMTSLPREDVELSDLRITVNDDSVNISCCNASGIPKAAFAALRELAMAHALASHATTVRGRIAIVTGTRCPRLHVDKVRLRTVCTLSGPGTVLAPREAINMDVFREQSSVAHTGLTTREHDELLLTQRRSLIQTDSGDAVFLIGAGGDVDNLDFDMACVHRSPRLGDRRRRLLVQIDDFAETN